MASLSPVIDCCLATGGCRDVVGAEIARMLGHTIEPPVPSLFSLHVPISMVRRCREFP